MDIHAVGRLDYGGRVESIETLGRYSSLDAILLARVAGAPGVISAESNYFLYRVTYRTAGVDGEPTSVSGLVAVPANRDIKGVVSWQHGTNTFRRESISKPTLLEGLGTSAIFAGDGFLMVAADYVGLGVSTEMHPYYHLQERNESRVAFSPHIVFGPGYDFERVLSVPLHLYLRPGVALLYPDLNQAFHAVVLAELGLRWTPKLGRATRWPWSRARRCAWATPSTSCS